MTVLIPGNSEKLCNSGSRMKYDKYTKTVLKPGRSKNISSLRDRKLLEVSWKKLLRNFEETFSS